MKVLENMQEMTYSVVWCGELSDPVRIVATSQLEHSMGRFLHWFCAYVVLYATRQAVPDIDATWLNHQTPMFCIEYGTI